MNKNLLDIVKESYGRVVYSHKIHEKFADRVSRNHGAVKLIELCLITATAGSTITVLLGSNHKAEIVSAILASLVLFVAIYQFRFNPEYVVHTHRAAAKRLWRIREQYVTLINDIVDGTISDEAARNIRDELIERLGEIYESAPPTDAKAYAAASVALKQDEELTFSDAEIDKFLPAGLRKQPVQKEGPADSPKIS